MDEQLKKENDVLKKALFLEQIKNEKALADVTWRSEAQKSKTNEVLAITSVLLLCAVVIIILLVFPNMK